MRAGRDSSCPAVRPNFDLDAAQHTGPRANFNLKQRRMGPTRPPNFNFRTGRAQLQQLRQLQFRRGFVEAALAVA